MAMSACCRVRGTPVINQRGLEKESAILFRVASSMPICVLNLVIVKKEGEENNIPGLTNTAVPHCLGPLRACRIYKLFNLSKKMTYVDMLWESP